MTLENYGRFCPSIACQVTNAFQINWLMSPTSPGHGKRPQLEDRREGLGTLSGWVFQLNRGDHADRHPLRNEWWRATSLEFHIQDRAANICEEADCLPQ